MAFIWKLAFEFQTTHKVQLNCILSCNDISTEIEKKYIIAYPPFLFLLHFFLVFIKMTKNKVQILVPFLDHAASFSNILVVSLNHSLASYIENSFEFFSLLLSNMHLLTIVRLGVFTFVIM